MRAAHVVGLNLQPRDAVGACGRVEDEIAVALVGIRLLRARENLDDAHVDAAALVLERAIEEQVAETVRRAVNLERLMVDVLVADGEIDAQQLGMAARALQVHIQEGLGEAAAPAHLDPAQVGIAAQHGAARQEVPRTVVEVLQVHVAHDRTVADDQLDDAGLHAILGAQQIVDDGDLSAFFGDDQRVMVAADAVAHLVQDHLERQRDARLGRHVDESARVPQRGVQRRELVQPGLDGLGHEVLLHQVGMLAHGALQVGKDDAALAQLGVKDAIAQAAVLKDHAGCAVHLVDLFLEQPREFRLLHRAG